MFLDYAGIRVRDLDRSLRFYTEALGLLEIRRGTMDHGGVWVLLEDRISRQRLELNWYPKGSKYDAPYARGEELDHLGFRVTDVAAAQAKLRAAGATAEEEFTEDGRVELAYLRDPDGIQIELIATPQA